MREPSIIPVIKFNLKLHPLRLQVSSFAPKAVFSDRHEPDKRVLSKNYYHYFLYLNQVLFSFLKSERLCVMALMCLHQT